MSQGKPLQEDQRKTNLVKKISRRKFLRNTGATCVLLLGLGGVGKFVEGKELLRPPGGQNEDSFISRCLKCDRCISICPTSVIGSARMSDGILEARTPLMNFHLGYCDFCNKCVEVCPTQALQPFQPDTVKIGLAVVNKATCIALDRRGCTICADKCPHDAITLDEQNHPVVDANKCNGCGICEYECPALVLRSYKGGKDRGIAVTPISQRFNLAKLIGPSRDLGGDRA